MNWIRKLSDEKFWAVSSQAKWANWIGSVSSNEFMEFVSSATFNRGQCKSFSKSLLACIAMLIARESTYANEWVLRAWQILINNSPGRKTPRPRAPLFFLWKHHIILALATTFLCCASAFWCQGETNSPRFVCFVLLNNPFSSCFWLSGVVNPILVFVFVSSFVIQGLRST